MKARAVIKLAYLGPMWPFLFWNLKASVIDLTSVGSRTAPGPLAIALRRAS